MTPRIVLRYIVMAMLCVASVATGQNAGDEVAVATPLPLTGGCEFNSELALDVYFVAGPDLNNETVFSEVLVGITPAPEPLAIPECRYWYVEPRDGVDTAAACQEVLSQRIPGLRLFEARDADIDDIIALEHLQALILYRTDLTESGIDRLWPLTELRILRLGGTAFSDRNVASLSVMTELRELGVGYTDISESGVADLVSFLPGLERLYLPSNTIGHAGLEHVATLDNLVALDLRSIRFDNDDLMPLAIMGGLEELYLGGWVLEELDDDGTMGLIPTGPADAHMAPLAGLTSLRVLILDHSRITDSGVAHLAGLQELEALYIHGRRVTDAGVVHLTGLSRLHALTLIYTDITDMGVAQLASLRALQQLDVIGSSINGTGLQSLTDLPLQRLCLRGTHITDDALAAIAEMPGLTELALDRTNISDAGLRHLAELTDLRDLRLGRTGITGSGLEYLEGLTSLESLSLTGTQITSQGLAYLAPLRDLRNLDLSTTPISDEGLPHLAGMRLRQLCLCETRVTDDALPHLTALPELQRLDLSETVITRDAVAAIRDEFPEGMSLSLHGDPGWGHGLCID
jgi:internalin A